MTDGDRELLSLFLEDEGTAREGEIPPGRAGGTAAWEAETIFDLGHALETFLQDDEERAVGTRLALFYHPGDRNRSLVPDLLVSRAPEGVLPETYRVWEQPEPPQLVIEVTEAAARIEDLGEKKGVYAAVGIPELVLYDPQGEYLDPPLRLYRLEGDEYRRVEGEPLRLESLGLELRLEGEEGRRLRLFDPELKALIPGRFETLNSVLAGTNEVGTSAAVHLQASEEVPEADELATELEEFRRF